MKCNQVFEISPAEATKSNFLFIRCTPSKCIDPGNTLSKSVTVVQPTKLIGGNATAIA